MPSGRKIILELDKEYGCLIPIKIFKILLKYKNSAQHQKMATCRCIKCESIKDFKVSVVNKNRNFCGRDCLRKFNFGFVPENEHLVKIGDKFARLTVTSIPFYKVINNLRQQHCLCNCECGKTGLEMVICRLKRGNTQSCGCLAGDSRRTGSIAKNGLKQCSRCKEIKEVSLFAKKTITRDGLNSRCIRCGKNDKLIRNYNITIEQYETILKSQNFCCKICGLNNPGRINNDFLYVDHCHDTGNIRGLLCTNCNTALGMFNDSIETLKSAIQYLAKAKNQSIKKVS